MEREAILELKNVQKYFSLQGSLRAGQKTVKAVDGVSLDVLRGETLSLVGESGCGKSTTGRCAIGLLPVTRGQVLYQGRNIAVLKERERRCLAGDLQMIFQDPYSSLNPRMTIGSILEEPLIIHKVCAGKTERMERVVEMLEKVGMRADQYYRFPHEFSGGQKQRVGIARALMLRPQMVVCDEPVSALDVSIQSQVLNLLMELRKELNITLLFISHNMSVVRFLSDRVGVMYLGHLVELAPTEELYGSPLHFYTQALFSAVPEVNPHVKKKQILLEGDIPSPIDPPSGCVFRSRCPCAMEVCGDEAPDMREVSPGHFVACYRYRSR